MKITYIGFCNTLKLTDSLNTIDAPLTMVVVVEERVRYKFKGTLKKLLFVNVWTIMSKRKYILNLQIVQLFVTDNRHHFFASRD